MKLFRSFLSVAKQYQDDPSKENMELILKQFDVLIGETSSATDLQFFDPRNLLVSESLMKMVDLLLDMRPEIVQKLFFLLGNLGNCPRLQKSLCCQLHIHSSLAVFLHSYCVSTKDTLVLQCLKLLEVYTYHAVLTTVESSVEYLLQLILKEIESRVSDALISCLGILSNLCRNSPTIVRYMKSLPNFNRIVRDLLENVSSPVQPILLHSMIILHALTRGDAVGQKVFNERNVCQTVEIVIRVCSTDELSAHRAATNLLSALLTTPEYQKHVQQCNQLDSALTAIWKALCKSKSPFFICNLQHLLVSMFSVDNMSSQVLSALLHLPKEDTHQVLTSLQEWAISADLNFFIHRVDALAWNMITLIAQELLKQTCEDTDFIESSVKCAFTQFLQRDISFDSPDVKMELEKILKMLEFLCMLCQSRQRDIVKQNASAESFQDLIKQQMEGYALIGDQQSSDLSAEIVVLALTVLGSLVPLSAELKNMYMELCKNEDIIPFLANGLMSSDCLQVQRVLNAVCTAHHISEFPTDTLGVAVATNIKLSESKHSEGILINSFPKVNDASSRHQSMDDSVQLLISKLESGLEIKDLEYVDIMEMYENKVHVLLRQVQELQKTVDSKTVALQQSDKQMSHYRCLQAQHEAEVLKLRSLLVESERRRNEQAKEDAKNLVLEKQSLQAQLQSAQDKILRLQREGEELLESNTEMFQRLKSAQVQIEELHLNADNLKEMNSVLQKQNNTLELKQNMLTEEVTTLSYEKRTLSKQLKEKETYVKDLNSDLEKCQEALEEKEQSLALTVKNNDDLKERLSDIQKRSTDLESQVSSLRKLCAQHQGSVLDKTQEIQVLTEKYNEQKKLTEQILALCSRKP